MSSLLDFVYITGFWQNSGCASISCTGHLIELPHKPCLNKKEALKFITIDFCEI